MNAIESLNAPYPSELNAFGSNWCGPEKYLAWKQTLVARYPAQEDGQTVWVYATAAPARFYAVRVFAKKGRQGITIKTGSGMGDQAAKIAEQISSGMLVIEPGKSK